jgi:hypothetical protein
MDENTRDLIMAKRKIPIGVNHEVLTVTSSAVVPLTESEYAPTFPEGVSGAIVDRAYMTIEKGQIRVLTTGSDPTFSVGHIKSNGDYLEIESQACLKKFRAIGIGDTDAILQVTYEGVG